MKTRLLRYVPLFAAALAAGWLLPAGRSRPAGGAAVSSAAGTAAPGQAGSRNAGIPQPSGLPGDLIHLENIDDTPTLRAAWQNADPETRTILIRRWAELDPADAIRFFLLDTGKGAARDLVATNTVFEIWTEQDPAACLRWICGLPDSSRLVSLMHFSFFDIHGVGIKSQLESAPQATMALWRGAVPVIRSVLCGQVFQYLFAHDPAAALNELEKLPETQRWRALSQAAETKEPGLLLQILNDRPELRCQEKAYGALCEAYAEKDIAGAQAFAESLPPGATRDQASVCVISKLAETDPDAALAWMESHAPTRENRESVYQEIAQSDPARALELCSKSGMSFPYQVNDHIKKLAENDWPTVEAMVTQAPDSRVRNQLLEAMGSGIAPQAGDSPQKLEPYLSLLSATGANSDAVSVNLLANVDSSQLPATTDWLATQPESLQAALFSALAYRLSKESPGIAAAWLARQPESPDRTHALLNNTATWASRDPQAAAEFSLTLPPGTDHDYAVLNLTSC